LLRQAAIFYSRLGNRQRAVELLEKAYTMAPDQAIFPYSLALLRAEENRLGETIQLLTIATRLDPGFDRAWYNLALALLRADRPNEARTALDQATSLRGTPEWDQASRSINQALRSR
jgi:tetratricopeptide (TPR) repeat protein